MLAAFAGRAPFQVALVVHDLERAVRDIDGLVGAGPWRGFVFDGTSVQGREYHGEPADWSFRVALNDSEPQLELIQPLAGPSIYRDWLEARGEGLHHLGYLVESIADATVQMAAAGHPAIQAGHSFGVGRDGAFAYYDTVDALGFVVEAVEPPGRMPDPSFRL
jgi:hypothetical protein